MNVTRRLGCNYSPLHVQQPWLAWLGLISRYVSCADPRHTQVDPSSGLNPALYVFLLTRLVLSILCLAGSLSNSYMRCVVDRATRRSAATEPIYSMQRVEAASFWRGWLKLRVSIRRRYCLVGPENYVLLQSFMMLATGEDILGGVGDWFVMSFQGGHSR